MTETVTMRSCPWPAGGRSVPVIWITSWHAGSGRGEGEADPDGVGSGAGGGAVILHGSPSRSTALNVSTVGPGLNVTYGTSAWPIHNPSSRVSTAPSMTVSPLRLMEQTLVALPES